jgi:hypothetical protein
MKFYDVLQKELFHEFQLGSGENDTITFRHFLLTSANILLKMEVGIVRFSESVRERASIVLERDWEGVSTLEREKAGSFGGR